MAGPLLAGLAIAAWTGVFRHYGLFDLTDEGTLLAQASRAARGQRPYLDFHTGYGPLHFLLFGWLVAHGGLDAVRAALVAAHAAGGAATFVATRRLVGTGGAAVALAVLAAGLLPVAARQGAPFLVPYPAWLAGLATLGCLLLVDRSHGAPGRLRAASAGALAGVAFAMKPNSGLLAAGGSMAALVLGSPGGPGAGPLARAILALLVLGALALVWPPGIGVLWWALVPPIVAMAGAGRHGLPDREAAPPAFALAAGFLAVAVPAYAGALRALGPVAFAREALLVGAPIASVYGVAYPAAALVAAGAGVLALRGQRGAAVATGLVALAVAMAHAALGVPSLTAGLRLGGERALLVAVPLVCWAGAAALCRGARAALVAPAAVAIPAALQLHPRADFLHLLPVAPALVPLAAWTARQAAGLLGAGGPRLVGAAALVAAAVRGAPTIATAAAVLAGRVTTVAVGDTRLETEPAGAARLEAVAAAAAAVAARTGPDDAVATFPGCALVPFVAGRLPAGRHDYFFPGRPTREEGAEVAAAFRAAPPPVAVTCDAAGTDLAAAWSAYPELVALFAERYAPVLDAPPFVVRVPAAGGARP